MYRITGGMELRGKIKPLRSTLGKTNSMVICMAYIWIERTVEGCGEEVAFAVQDFAP